jgi:hypothetical protein
MLQLTRCFGYTHEVISKELTSQALWFIAGCLLVLLGWQGHSSTCLLVCLNEIIGKNVEKDA